MREVLAWDSASKQLLESGDAVMAEGFRTRLQRMSGLTAEEAGKVLSTAVLWQGELQEANRKVAEVSATVRAAHPGEHMTDSNSPEIKEAWHQRWSVATSAVNQLLAELGPKSFAKLDFFIDHKDDHAKEIKARSDAYKAAHPEEKP